MIFALSARPIFILSQWPDVPDQPRVDFYQEGLLLETPSLGGAYTCLQSWVTEVGLPLLLPEPPIEKASLVAQVVKNLLAMQETWVGKIARRREWLPHQYSCLENSMDRGAWRAMVHGVAKSQM